MKTVKKIFLPALVLILLGQGCMFGEKEAPLAPDGGMWQTEDAGLTWTQLDSLPGSTDIGTISGVNISAFEIDPSDKTAYYIGTEQNGMFYSINSGNVWQRPESQDVRNGFIRDIEVDPRNVCTIYVLRSYQLFKSTDCNRTYEAMYSETREDEHFTSLAIDWFNPDTLYLGNSAGEILRSTDNAKNWTRIYRLSDKIRSVELSNKDSRIILVGTGDRGIYRSPDAGETWQHFEKEIGAEFKDSDIFYNFAQNRDGSVLIMNSKYGLLRSTDAGANWNSIRLTTPPGDVRIWGVAVHPDNPDILYYGTMGIIYSSSNGGESWATQEMPSTRASKIMSVHPEKTDRLIVGFAAIEQ
ncbi:MAG: YCF48-related protein [Patescibacteria group bacterium]